MLGVCCTMGYKFAAVLHHDGRSIINARHVLHVIFIQECNLPLFHLSEKMQSEKGASLAARILARQIVVTARAYETEEAYLHLESLQVRRERLAYWASVRWQVFVTLFWVAIIIIFIYLTVTLAIRHSRLSRDEQLRTFQIMTIVFASLFGISLLGFIYITTNSRSPDWYWHYSAPLRRRP